MSAPSAPVKVPFLDLKAQYRSIKPEIDAAIQKVLDSTQFVLGDEVAAFEREFAEYGGAKHGIAVNSGTSALHLAMLAAGIGPGDEVITVPNTFVATVAAVRYTGARAVYVDIDPARFTMDPARVEAAIGPRTKAILPVHLYGQPADMDPILEIARRRGLLVVEDAAQAHGARYQGRPVGSLGDLACFSFYPGKNLGAYGEGGIVLTSNDEYAKKIRMLRDWGAEKKYHHLLAGYNYRMEGMQGAILRVKLRHLEGWTEARRANAARYAALLADCGVGIPVEAPGARHVWHVYAVRTRERDPIMKALGEQGIQTGIHYPIPVHLQPAYADPAYARGSFPLAEKAADEVTSLPMFPELTDEQLQLVAGALHRLAHAR
jgi:dTDP-4-amino-4,6-dideoxygalactose transaminase